MFGKQKKEKITGVRAFVCAHHLLIQGIPIHPDTELTFTTTPPSPFTIIGPNALIIASAPQKLTSNILLATSKSTSSAGITYKDPALLTRQSNFPPPVSISTVLTAAAIEAAEVTSMASNVTSGSVSNGDILDSVRAEAKTWKPWRWKECARANPMPPLLQPVMRTDLRAICRRRRSRRRS